MTSTCWQCVVLIYDALLTQISCLLWVYRYWKIMSRLILVVNLITSIPDMNFYILGNLLLTTYPPLFFRTIMYSILCLISCQSCCQTNDWAAMKVFLWVIWRTEQGHHILSSALTIFAYARHDLHITNRNALYCLKCWHTFLYTHMNFVDIPFLTHMELVQLSTRFRGVFMGILDHVRWRPGSQSLLESGSSTPNSLIRVFLSTLLCALCSIA